MILHDANLCACKMWGQKKAERKGGSKCGREKGSKGRQREWETGEGWCSEGGVRTIEDATYEMHCEALVALRIRTVKNVTLCVCALLPLPVVAILCECCLYCVCVCAVCMKRPKIAFVCQATRSWLLGAQQRAAGSGSQFALRYALQLTERHTHTQSGTHTHARTCREGARDTYSLTCCWPCVRFMMLCVCVCVSKYHSVCVSVCVAVWLHCVLHVAALWRLK